MIGSILGVGIFGLPYAFAQSGFVLGFLVLLLIAGVLVVMQFMLAELSLQTKGNHRLVGFVEVYLGHSWRWVAFAAMTASIWGAMLAYMIIGGKFLHVILAPIMGGSPLIYAYVVAAISGVLIYRGLQFISRFEFVIICTLLFLFLFMILASLPHISLSNLTTLNWSNSFVPYGVILFALSSVGVVPEMREILAKKAKNKLGIAILVGMITVVSLYSLFAFSVLGVTGDATTSVAFDGLVPVLGSAFAIVASLLGSLVIISIFTMSGIPMMNNLRNDLNMSRANAWMFVMIVPIVLFAIGLREFNILIGFVGSVFGGTLGIFIVASYLKMLKSPLCRDRKCLNFPLPLSLLVIALFASGIIYQLITLFFT